VLVPRLGRHWFLAMADLEVAAADAVRDAPLSFSPSSAREDFLARAGTGGEWCLSHQVWAGQPVPVARCLDCGQVAVAVDGDTSCGKCMGMLTPDDGVLDARFVGAMAVLAAAGWPEAEAGPAEVAPWTTLVVGPTGVARWALPMVALSVRLAGTVPFARIAVHQAPDGEVAVGEVQELVDRSGAPAVRLALVTGGLDVAAACDLVALIEAPSVGESSLADTAAAWDAAFDAGVPAAAVTALAAALAAGVEPGDAPSFRALAAPVLGA
jgi:valyl-tRNA synthetase